MADNLPPESGHGYNGKAMTITGIIRNGATWEEVTSDADAFAEYVRSCYPQKAAD